MEPEERALRIIDLLEPEYPNFETALDWDEDWQLVAAVLLSAQTTDENVNQVTKKLFRQYPTPESIASAPREDIEKAIFSTGYYRAKAKNLQGMCQKLIDDFSGVVPDTMEELITLPGVGRKTANVVLHVLHNRAEGIVMDTHIARLTHRLGFLDKKDPVRGEQVMMEILPKEQWKNWGDLLIQHGREVCYARKPVCEKCTLSKVCPSAFSFE